MKKLKLIFVLIILVASRLLFSQTINEIQAWGNKQSSKYNSSDVAAFINKNRSGGEITFGDTFTYSTIFQGAPQIATLDESRFVIAYSLGVQFPDGVARVGTINDSTITFGPEFTFNIGSGAPASMCKIDSNKIVIAYKPVNQWPTPSDGAIVVGEIIDDVISFGSTFIFNMGETNYISTCSLDTEHFIIAYLDGINRYDTAYVKLGTITGSTVSFSNSVLMSDGWVTKTSATSLDSSSFIVTYTEWFGPRGVARAGTIIGDSIVLGPEANFTTMTPWYICATTMNDSCFVVAYNETAIYAKAIVGMVDNNIITFGNPTIFEYNRIETVYVTKMDEYHFVLSYEDRENIYSPRGTTILGTISGLDITFGAEYVFSIYSDTRPCPTTALDPNRFIVVFPNGNNSWIGTTRLGTISPNPIHSIVDSNTTCAGIYSVPILVQDLYNVSEFSLFLNYDSAYLNYVSYQNLNSILVSDSLSITADSGEINIFYSTDALVSIPTDTLIELIFNINSLQNLTVTNLSWNDSSSYYLNFSGDTTNAVFEDGSVTILASIGNISSITGPVSIDLGTTLSSEYFIITTENTTSYEWYIDPPDAGIINGIDTSAIVNWNEYFVGLVSYIYVEAMNECGQTYSDSLIVDISPVELSLHIENPEITISPNPSNGIFNISCKGAEEYVNLYITNANGKIIRHKRIFVSENESVYRLDLSDKSSGIYYIKFISENKEHKTKVIILR